LGVCVDYAHPRSVSASNSISTRSASQTTKVTASVKARERWCRCGVTTSPQRADRHRTLHTAHCTSRNNTPPPNLPQPHSNRDFPHILPHRPCCPSSRWAGRCTGGVRRCVEWMVSTHTAWLECLVGRNDSPRCVAHSTSPPLPILHQSPTTTTTSTTSTTSTTTTTTV